MNHYELEPAWYYSAPYLAWDAALKITKVQLELSSDPDMLLMIEIGIRGGHATISHRHAKAEKSKFISYLHAKNHYGWTMSKQLPTSGFEWRPDDELDDWKHLSCFLEGDLEYPEQLR